jgi:cytochrome c biogenesis protein CcmG, thiol:disulfide interchange protein DsbE
MPDGRGQCTNDFNRQLRIAAKGYQTMGLFFRAGPVLSLLAALYSYTASPARADDLDLGAYKGKVVYLDFWASWCAPCRVSFPWMNEIQQTYGNRGLVVIGVNVDRDRGPADEFLQANYPQFKIVYDPNGKIASKYDFKDMPTSFLIGRDGKIRYMHSGFLLKQNGKYIADINMLLNEKAP